MELEKLYFQKTIRKKVMKVNGKRGKCMGKGYLFGKTDQFMMESIIKIKKKDLENLFIHLVKFMKGIGRKENSMALALCLIKLELSRKEGFGRQAIWKKPFQMKNGKNKILFMKININLHQLIF